MKSDLIVVGAGAAGIMAALSAAQNGVSVLLIERNKSIGRKLLITGAGRCNLTNRSETNEIISNVPGNGRFLNSVLRRFGAEDLMRLVEDDLGVPLKVERGRRVFPVSDLASDIVVAFEEGLKRAGVRVITETRVDGFLFDDRGEIVGVTAAGNRKFEATKVIVATGGASYPGTGSTGDGYRLAVAAGHTVQAIFPSLAPLETVATWPKRVEGLTLTNIAAASYHRGVKLEREFGDLLFTGFGISGPVVLSLSRKIAPLVAKEPGSVIVELDLKPALTEEELDRRIQRDFQKYLRKVFKNALDDLLPKSMIPVMIELSGIDPLKPVHQITREERLALVKQFKHQQLTVSRVRPLSEAIVTAGGVTTKEINPRTMESKIRTGLYFVGEVVDVDAYTGGYNLQIAFSMGYAAARDVAAKLESERKPNEAVPLA